MKGSAINIIWSDSLDFVENTNIIKRNRELAWDIKVLFRS